MCGEVEEPDCDTMCWNCLEVVPGAAGDPVICNLACPVLSPEVARCMTACAERELCDEAATCTEGRSTAGCEDFCEWAVEACNENVWIYLPQDDCPDTCGSLMGGARVCLSEMAGGETCEDAALLACLFEGGEDPRCEALCQWAADPDEGCGMSFGGLGAEGCALACVNDLMATRTPDCAYEAQDANDCTALADCRGIFSY